VRYLRLLLHTLHLGKDSQVHDVPDPLLPQHHAQGRSHIGYSTSTIRC
jgi:hypothetical protein